MDGHRDTFNPPSGKSIVIDQAEIVRLLQVYEQLGEVIQIIANEVNQQNEEILSQPSEIIIRQEPSRISVKATSPSQLKQKSQLHTESHVKIHTDLSHKSPSSVSISVKDGVHTARIKSDLIKTTTPNNVVPVYSRELNKRHTSPAMRNNHERHDECTNVYIKIQCFTDPDDGYADYHSPSTILKTKCDQQSTPHYHISLGGEPVILQVDETNVEEGAVYCINTRKDEGENAVKIIIKRCPKCFSTVIGSSTKIKDMLGESHESVTLHGKSVKDEAVLSYSAEDISSDTAPSKSKVQISTVLSDHETITDVKVSGSKVERHIHVETETDNAHKSKQAVGKEPSGSRLLMSPSRPSKIRSRTLSETRELSKSKTLSQSSAVSKSRTLSETREASKSKVLVTHPHPSGSKVQISQPHLEVVIDTENVEEPDIQINGEVLLRRKRVCSSMEFDVSTAQTRLREQELEHSNSNIVVELGKMGVNQLLRSCRPARCCRKAILNERQKTGLPYCVSLKSLPLMGNDAEVIKQSYEMSVNKIKNTLDLSQIQKETLAYYISLGTDDFRPKIDFPWVGDNIGDEGIDVSTEKEQVKAKNPLEFYVSLEDGDLVWGESLPLGSQSYNAYFNHNNVRSVNETPRPPVLKPAPAGTSLRMECQLEVVSLAKDGQIQEHPNAVEVSNSKEILEKLPMH